MKTLTTKEKKAAEGILAGKTIRQAIMEAYSCKSLVVADALGQQVFKRKKLIDYLQIYRDSHKELIPKALAVLDNILETTAKGEVTWDVQRKTAEDILRRAFEEEDKTKITKRVEFIKQFYVQEKEEKKE